MALIPLDEIKKHSDSFRRRTIDVLDGNSEIDRSRKYLGMSGVGGECLRAMQLNFYKVCFSEIPANLRRIFQMGHLIEKMVVDELIEIGMKVYGTQDEVIGFGGHWLGHIDGVILGLIENPDEEHLLEVKSMKNELFCKFQLLGLEKSHPVYYDQVMIYMHYKKLDKTFFIVMNKNTQLYATEIIEYDNDRAEELLEKTREVLLADKLFERIGTYDSYVCQYCRSKEYCFGKIEINPNCRNCDLLDILPEGKFECQNKIKDLSNYEDQLIPCRLWTINRML